jgi:hypothetical protein
VIEPRIETDGELLLDFNYQFAVETGTEALRACGTVHTCFSNARGTAEKLLCIRPGRSDT